MAKRCYLPDLSKELSGHHGQRHRRFTWRYPTPGLSAKTGRRCYLVDAFLCLSQVDNGYDVANYTAIDPTYGTLDDFDELVTQAKSRSIRVILDMVFNHTSTQHAWFHEALKKESPYRQFYIWRDGEPGIPRTTGVLNSAAMPGVGTQKADSTIYICLHQNRRTSTGRTRRYARN